MPSLGPEKFTLLHKCIVRGSLFSAIIHSTQIPRINPTKSNAIRFRRSTWDVLEVC